MIRARGEDRFDESQREAVAKAAALLRSGDIDAESMAAMMRRALAPAIENPDAPLRVWDVLTVDVVDGRIQTVRIVRNPDKLAHL